MADLIHRRGGKQHNLLRAAHYDKTHKYERQRVRTAANKARRLKAIADNKPVEE